LDKITSDDSFSGTQALTTGSPQVAILSTPLGRRPGKSRTWSL
jgi:hypothetical protein